MAKRHIVDIRNRYVDLDSSQIHVRGSLEDDPRTPVLLLHMTPLSSAVYERALRPLAEFARPLAIDTPGFGRSERLSYPPGIAAYSEIVHDLVDKLDLSRPVLVGQHTGASIAIEYALRYPEEISALVLSGVPVVSEAEATQRLRGKETFEPDEDGSHIKALWERSRLKHSGLNLETATHYLAQELEAGSRSYIDAYTAVYEYPIERKLAELATLQVPVLLLYGTNDCIAKLQPRAAELLPDAKVWPLEGLTDFLADDDPARFVSAIKDFLNENSSSFNS